MGYTDFDCTHLYLGMVSFIQLLVVFSVLLQLIDSLPIPDDVIHELVSWIIVPTGYHGCWDHLTWQKFIRRIVQPLWKDRFKDEKNMCHFSRISCWYEFMVLACSTWNSPEHLMISISERGRHCSSLWQMENTRKLTMTSLLMGKYMMESTLA